jgi:Ca2+-binding EF-hand superfamily protein
MNNKVKVLGPCPALTLNVVAEIAKGKTDEELMKLRTYFNSLDDDDGGSIGVDELEEPLIALGLVDNRQQVQKIV